MKFNLKNISNCPKCSKKPKAVKYFCKIQGTQLIRIACPTGCSSTFAVKQEDVVAELWEAFVNWFKKNPNKVYIKP